MRWLFLITLGATLLGAGCEKTIYRSHESQYCSSTENDEPYYECAKGSDLVCITTYQMTYGTEGNAPPKTLDIWLCRLACDPTVENPCRSGEKCCPGMIYGRTYGKTHACVMDNLCPALVRPRDGGGGSDARDGGSDLRLDGGSDGSGDGATGDGGIGDGGDASLDVPQADPDAPVDLPPG